MIHDTDFVLLAEDAQVIITKLDETPRVRVFGTISVNRSGTFVWVRGYEFDQYSTRDKLKGGTIVQTRVVTEGCTKFVRTGDRPKDYDKILSTNNTSFEVTEYNRKNLE